MRNAKSSAANSFFLLFLIFIPTVCLAQKKQSDLVEAIITEINLLRGNPPA